MRNNPKNPRDAVTRFAPAEKLFAKLDSVPFKVVGETVERRDGDTKRYWSPPRKGWTPAPDISALKVNTPHRGRDMESLARYHTAHKRGRTDDDALKEKFGRPAPDFTLGGKNLTTIPDRAPASPALKSVDEAWPKWVRNAERERVRLDGEGTAEWFARGGEAGKCLAYIYEPSTTSSDLAYTTESEALAWLDANGHKAYADTLRAKMQPVDDLYEPTGTVPVVGDRVTMGGIIGKGAEFVISEFKNVNEVHHVKGDWFSAYWLDKPDGFRILKRAPAPQAHGVKALKIEGAQ